MPAVFDYIQTFYINSDAVNGAGEIMITSLDLFFKGKPALNRNVSGSSNPGISVWLCEVVSGQPNPSSVIKKSVTTVPYERINTSMNALSATAVSFTHPIIVGTGKSYGVVIKYDDPAFDIWVNKQGDSLVSDTGSTNTPSPGSQSRFDGLLFKSTNSNDFVSFADRDLKFKVNIAKFGSDAGTFPLVNKPYEFFTVSTSSGNFLGGEWVYQENTPKTGTLTVSSSNTTITGTGTTFTTGHLGLHVVVSNGSVIDVLKVVDVVNATAMVVDKYPRFTGSSLSYRVPPIGRVYFTDYTKKKVVLVDSNAANVNHRFVTGLRLKGERSLASANVASLDFQEIDEFTPKFYIGSPSTANFKIDFKCANTTNILDNAVDYLQVLKKNKLKKKHRVLSRSQEVVEVNLYGDNSKSAVANVSITINTSNTNLFSVPYIKNDQLDVYTYQNEINASTTETRYGITDFDTEVERNGIAKSKYICKKITFDENKYAEDTIVYVTAYRPSGTNIKVYAKIHNSADRDAFDDKAWTPLELKNNVDKFSGEDANDLVEYTYGLPQTPEVYSQLTGNFVTDSGNNIISATVDPTTSVSIGDLIKVTAPLFPENHEVFVVMNANSTSITINKGVTNLNIIGNVQVDKLKYKNVAWNNIANDNVARYVSSSLVEFDYYNTMQIKVVLLADDTNVVPTVEQIQVIGASA